MSSSKFLCGYCDKYFATAAKSSCGSCEHSVGCKKIKCPYCGYDNPPPEEMPVWLKKIRQIFVKGTKKI